MLKWNHQPVPRIDCCICLDPTTNCDSSLTENVSIQSANYSNSEGVIKTKWISNC